MPNRSMQMKHAKGATQRAAYATDADRRTSYTDTPTREHVEGPRAVDYLVAEYYAKLAARKAAQIKMREALGHRASYAWSR